MYPGCDNERIDGTGACYKHGSNASSNTYKSTGSSYSRSNYKDEYKKYDTYNVYDCDDPDDFISNFAEDFAYDEFGEDSWEAYEYGYYEADDYWMDEIGE